MFKRIALSIVAILLAAFVPTATAFASDDTCTIWVWQNPGGVTSPDTIFDAVLGRSYTFTFTPDTGFYVYRVFVNGVSVGAVSSYTLDVQQAVSYVECEYLPLQSPSYVIHASSGYGGSISPGGSVSVEQGSSQTFTITPADGYVVDDVVVDGVSVGAVTTYTFSDVHADCGISVTFKVNISPPPSGGAGGGGDLTVFSTERVQEVGEYIASSIGSIFSVALWLFMSVLGIYLAIEIVSDIAR